MCFTTRCAHAKVICLLNLEFSLTGDGGLKMKGILVKSVNNIMEGILVKSGSVLCRVSVCQKDSKRH